MNSRETGNAQHSKTQYDFTRKAKLTKSTTELSVAFNSSEITIQLVFIILAFWIAVALCAYLLPTSCFYLLLVNINLKLLDSSKRKRNVLPIEMQLKTLRRTDDGKAVNSEERDMDQ